MPLIGTGEAARIGNTTRQRIYSAIERGELTPVPDLPVVLLVSEEVEAWAKDHPSSKGGRPRKQKEVTHDGN